MHPHESASLHRERNIRRVPDGKVLASIPGLLRDGEIAFEGQAQGWDRLASPYSEQTVEALADCRGNKRLRKAREAGRGLWSIKAVAPWEWRGNLP
jgi:hypothetical protein